MIRSVLFAAALAVSPTAIAATDAPEAPLTARSTRTVAETIDRLEAAAREAGFNIIARVDHAAAAHRVNLELRPTTLLIFGRAQGGTPLMVCDQRAGLDLPLKGLAWEDEAGQVRLMMTDPADIQARRNLGPACDAPVSAVTTALSRLLAQATR